MRAKRGAIAPFELKKRLNMRFWSLKWFVLCEIEETCGKRAKIWDTLYIQNTNGMGAMHEKGKLSAVVFKLKRHK